MSEPRPPWGIARVRAALRRRRHGPYPALARIEEQLGALAGRLAEIETRVVGIEPRLEGLASMGVDRGDLAHALRALAAGETENRRWLAGLRESAEYERAWTEARPLVSVTVATLGRPELTSRALPSILAQSHGKLEAIVASDGAPPGTEASVTGLGDERLRYLDLGPRQTWTDDPARLWMVGATRARNAAVAAARGSWIVEFDDDDAMRPECLESLLELARDSRAEAVYGQVRAHRGDEEADFCSFPPRLGRFSWAGGMYHGGLRFFGRELLAADLGLPGDWWLAERMLRAGVRFAMSDDVLCDVYPSARAAPAREGRTPWGEP